MDATKIPGWQTGIGLQKFPWIRPDEGIDTQGVGIGWESGKDTQNQGLMAPKKRKKK